MFVLFLAMGSTPTPAALKAGSRLPMRRNDSFAYIGNIT